MKLTKIIYCIFCLLLTGCSTFTRDEELVNEIICDHISFEKKHNHLQLVASGYSMPEKVKKFMIYYKSNQKLTYYEAEALVLNCGQNLLDIINCNEEIFPFLDHYPFTEKDIEIKILFVDQKGEPFLHPYVSKAKIEENGLIECYYFEEKDGGNK